MATARKVRSKPARPATPRVAAERGGFTLREKEPLNLESPFSSLAELITPVESFYIRNHFAIPREYTKTWRLRIEGDVKRPLEFTYDEIRRLPATKKVVTLECAGNGRVYLVPTESGIQWQLGAVGTAEWTGVVLADLLRRAGVHQRVSEIVLEGSDKGEPPTEPRPAGKIHYARSLPLAKARRDVLLAYEMNGQELSPAHGFPLRAIVPSWYGMASVKWLRRIIISSRPFSGYFQSTDYAYWKQEPDLPPTRVPISDMRIKAQIARPTFGEVVQARAVYRVLGAAWTGGDAHASRIEISTDGGMSYKAGVWITSAKRGVWRLWQYLWKVPSKRGRAVVIARAIDSAGRKQPVSHDKNCGGYMIHHVLPVEIEIR